MADSMTSREVVTRTVKFEKPGRLARDVPGEVGCDFEGMGMSPSPDARPGSGVDEWGTVWRNIGVSHLGEVAEPALKDWADWDRLRIPDIADPRRWGKRCATAPTTTSAHTAGSS